ncbi:hypothetical protein JB92DRAFT_2177242 [Gautieria morchelliformis]|nr:hypothetical protein JB92DRAFT_2177242 [Gautieria morchelliformis]
MRSHGHTCSLVHIPKAALPDLQMRHLSLQSIFPPNFASLPRSTNAPRPVSPVLPQRTATVQSPGPILQILSSPDSVQRQSLPNRPVPNRPQMVHPSFPANVPLYDPASRCLYGRLHKPNPATSKPHTRHKPQTSQDYDSSAWWRPRETKGLPPNGSPKNLTPNHPRRNRLRFDSPHSSPVRLTVPP